jgi:anti-anti-sigma factor
MLLVVPFLLRDLDLGGFDAESDHLLSDRFVTTPYVREALTGRRTLFLGRKGSGKSALFRNLPALISDQESTPALSVPITPDAYAWGTLKQYEESGYSVEAAHRSAWKLTLAIQVASWLVQREDLGNDEGTKRAHGQLTHFLKDNYGTQAVDFRRATRTLRNVRSIKISAFGAGLEVARQDDDDGPSVTPEVADALFDLIAQCTRVVPVVVLLDRLDEEWDGSPRAHKLLVGLLMAVKEINDRFAGPPGKRQVRVLLFLRSDIYDALRYDDKDKHRSSEQHLVWTADTLHELVTRRLPPGVTPDALFSVEQMPGTETPPFAYLVERTFLRPREVLQFLSECIQRAGPDSPRISVDDIAEAEAQFSRWKLDDLKQEYAKSLPALAPLLDALHQQLDRFNSIGELEALLSKHPAFDTHPGGQRPLEILFETSVIGIQAPRAGGQRTGGDQEVPRYKCADPAAVLPADGTVFIHPALHTSLGIVERPADDEGIGFGVRTHTTDSGDWVIAVTGDLDLYTAPELKNRLLEAVEAARGRVLVDLTDCHFLDSSTLGPLQMAAKRLSEGGRQLELIVPDTTLRRIFDLTGLDKVFPIHASRTAAFEGRAAEAAPPPVRWATRRST